MKTYCLKKHCLKTLLIIFILGWCVQIADALENCTCLGDSDRDHIISKFEAKSAIHQFLGLAQVQECYDEYGDGMVGINDLQNIIYHYINGCDAKDRYENDDTPETATTLNLMANSCGGEDIITPITTPRYEPFQPHNFHSAEDVDWMQFYALKINNTYSIDIDDVGTTCDPVIELYDADKKLIQVVDDRVSGEAEFLELRPNIDSLYYLKITNYNSSLYQDGYGYKEGYENFYKVKFYLPVGCGE